MNPKPSHLGLKYAEQFKDPSLVAVYHRRRPYPDEAISKLVALVTGEPRTSLDVGCGTGDLARRLVHHVERVDAVDFSFPMIDKGRTLPGGDHPRLNWIYGRVEEVALRPPYALITAGESLYWMKWEIVFPLFQCILTPGGILPSWCQQVSKMVDHQDNSVLAARGQSGVLAFLPVSSTLFPQESRLR